MQTESKKYSPSLYSRLVVWTLLHLFGWRKCTLGDGSPGWYKKVSERVTRRGPATYALRHLSDDLKA